MKTQSIHQKLIGIFLLAISLATLWGCRAEPKEPTPTVLPIETQVLGKYDRPGDFQVFMIIAGAERTFFLHIPPTYHPDTPVPLVFNIHGRTDTAEHQQKMTQFNAKADEAGFIVVTPQAEDDPPTWWGAVPGTIGAPDITFFAAMLDYLQNELSIDPARIYAAGFSNGASMANRLACAFSDVFAAVAPVSGGHVGYYECEAAQPISVLAFHGLADSIIPFEGNQFNPLVQDWMGAWAQRNECQTTPAADSTHADITRYTWEGCLPGLDVTLYAIENAGHTWPGSDFVADAGGTTQAINATDIIWDFFAAHPKAAGTIIPPTLEPTPEPVSGYATPGDYFKLIKSDGYERTFWLHVPAGYDPATPAALVINFHGRTSNAFDQADLSLFSATADKYGFIVVYPQATGNPATWEDFPESVSGVDDVQFTRDLIAHLSTELNIDPARVYATGLSNGGGMANRLACDLADQIAAIAPVAGGYYYWEDCAPSRPVAVIAFHGQRDTIIPYGGTDYDEYVNLPAVPVWAAGWAKSNQCSAEPEHLTSGGVITTDTWRECADNADVVLYSLAMEGHNWPTTTFGGDVFDPTTVNDLIWEFFAAHPMP